MNISEEDKIIINNRFPDNIDEAALTYLIHRTYCKFFTGNEQPPKVEFDPTDAWTFEARRLKTLNPEMTIEDLSRRMMSNWKLFFLNTFRQFYF